jgi:hypothetical protein
MARPPRLHLQVDTAGLVLYDNQAKSLGDARRYLGARPPAADAALPAAPGAAPRRRCTEAAGPGRPAPPLPAQPRAPPRSLPPPPQTPRLGRSCTTCRWRRCTRRSWVSRRRRARALPRCSSRLPRPPRPLGARQPRRGRLPRLPGVPRPLGARQPRPDAAATPALARAGPAHPYQKDGLAAGLKNHRNGHVEVRSRLPAAASSCQQPAWAPPPASGCQRPEPPRPAPPQDMHLNDVTFEEQYNQFHRCVVGVGVGVGVVCVCVGGGAGLQCGGPLPRCLPALLAPTPPRRPAALPYPRARAPTFPPAPARTPPAPRSQGHALAPTGYGTVGVTAAEADPFVSAAKRRKTTAEKKADAERRREELAALQAAADPSAPFALHQRAPWAAKEAQVSRRAAALGQLGLLGLLGLLGPGARGSCRTGGSLPRPGHPLTLPRPSRPAHPAPPTPPARSPCPPHPRPAGCGADRGAEGVYGQGGGGEG